MVLADHDFNIQAEIIFVAQNLDDTAAWIVRGGRPISNLDVNHNIFQVVWPGALCLFTQHPMRALLRLFSLGVFTGFFGKLKSGWDDDFLCDLLIDRSHVVVTIAIVEEADYGRMGSVQ